MKELLKRYDYEEITIKEIEDFFEKENLEFICDGDKHAVYTKIIYR